MNDAGESCYPSIRTLAKETGLSRQAVMEHLDKARVARWICVSRHGFSGQIWRRNEYSIAWPPEKAVNQGDHEAVNQGDHEAVNQGDHEAVNQGDHEAVNQGDHEAVNQGDLSLSVVNSSNSTDRDASVSIARKILSDLRQLNPIHHEPDWPKWEREIALILSEGRTQQEVLELWEFAHSHRFWRTNILSPASLRKRWDQLVILRSATKGSSAGTKEDTRCTQTTGEGNRCANRGTVRRSGGPWLCSDCAAGPSRVTINTGGPTAKKR